MPHSNLLILATVRPPNYAEDQKRVLGPRPSALHSRFPPRKFTQDIQVMVGLLKGFGKLDPEAAARILDDLTVRLVAEVKRNRPDCGLNEVPK